MPALPTTLPTAGNARVSDNTYLTIATGATGTQTVALDNMPTDFVAITDASWTIEYNILNRNDDTEALAVRITNGSQILAAADAAGTFVTVNSNVTNTTDTTAGPTAFAYVNTAATKADWDAASVEIRQTHSAFMNNDNASIRVDYFALTGNYSNVAFTTDQNAFRIRVGDTNDNSVALNAAFAGGDPALNTNATLLAETPFRIRFEIEETSGGSGSITPLLQYRRNGGTWTTLTRYPDDPDTATLTDPTEMVDSYPTNIDGVATTQIIGSGTFVAGSGDDNNTVSAISLTANSKTEVEFLIVIRKLTMTSGGTPGENANGDTFEYRVTNNGTALGTYTNTPTITLSTLNKIGGCYPESASRVGPIKDDNGNLYWLQEYAEFNPQLVMLKSTDGGDTWVGQDTANRPTQVDMESLSMAYDGSTGIIHILHYRDSGTGVYYHRYHASDHPSTPDTWAIKDEVVTATPTLTDQVASIEPRSDGTIVAFYTNGGATGDIVYKIRSTGGTWGTEVSTDTQASTWFNGVGTVRNTANDTIHIFYSDATNAILYHRTLNSSDTLSGRQSIATNVGSSLDERWPVLNPVLYDDSGTESVWVIFIDDSDQRLRCRELRNGTPQTETNATTEAVRTGRLASRQPQADLVRDPTNNTLYLVYVAGPADSTNPLDLFVKSKASGGSWGSRTLLREDPLSGTVGGNTQAFGIDFVRAQLFTHSSGNGSARVIGMVLDDRPSYTLSTVTHAGFTGGGVYQEYVVAEGGATVSGATATETDTANAGSTHGLIAGVTATETDTANAGAVSIGQVIAGAVASETDTASSGTPHAAIFGATATEADSANAGTPHAVLFGATGSETDTANAGTINVGQTVFGLTASETDTANAGSLSTAATVAGATATETDAAAAGTPHGVLFGASASETDTANAGSIVTSSTVFGATATETDSANAGSTFTVTSVSGSTATETDTANAGVRHLTTFGLTAAEVDTANQGAARLTYPGTTATETDTPAGGTIGLAALGATATETDTANTGSIQSGNTIIGHTATEVDTPNAGTPVVFIPLRSPLTVEDLGALTTSGISAGVTSAILASAGLETVVVAGVTTGPLLGTPTTASVAGSGATETVVTAGTTTSIVVT